MADDQLMLEPEEKAKQQKIRAEEALKNKNKEAATQEK